MVFYKATKKIVLFWNCLVAARIGESCPWHSGVKERETMPFRG